MKKIKNAILWYLNAKYWPVLIPLLIAFFYGLWLVFGGFVSFAEESVCRSIYEALGVTFIIAYMLSLVLLLDCGVYKLFKKKFFFGLVQIFLSVALYFFIFALAGLIAFLYTLGYKGDSAENPASTANVQLVDEADAK